MIQVTKLLKQTLVIHLKYDVLGLLSHSNFPWEKIHFLHFPWDNYYIKFQNFVNSLFFLHLSIALQNI